MTKFLLSCLLFISVAINAQITLGEGSTEVGAVPISTYYGYSYAQQIYTKQEINANAAGNITGLKFYLDPSMSIANSSEWVVYLGQTTKTSFTSDSDWVPLAQLTQVFSGTVTNVNGVIEVVFSTPFPYNNTSNLVVAAEENSAGYDSNNFEEAMHVYTGALNSSIYYKNDSTDPDPASPPSSFANLENYKSVITFEGLTANPIPACPLITYPVNNATFIPLTSTITWNNSSGATGYKVSIGTTSGGTDVVNQAAVATNSFTSSTPLTPNTNYYLRVISVGTGGESTGCTEVMFTSAPPVPTNDECATAITLTVNPDMNCGVVTPGYTIGATDSGTDPDPCYGTADDDVWFKFVATAPNHMISLLNIQSVGSEDNTDTYFQVFSGGCGALMNMLCSDDESNLVTGLTVGETYLVRVYSYSSDPGSNQSFNICVGTLPPPPANDDCGGALSATSFPYTYVQSDAVGATNGGGMVTTCTDEMNDGTWFTFVGDGDTFNISVSMPAGSIFDPQIGVYSGNCSALSCEATADTAYQGGTETISIPTLAGNTYYVNVGNYSGSSDILEGAFTINITKGVLATSEVKADKKKIKLYPNPFTDVLNISEAPNVKSISVSDVSGRLVKVIDNPGSAIYLEELKQGMYLMTLHMKDGSKQTVKTIKK